MCAHTQFFHTYFQIGSFPCTHTHRENQPFLQGFHPDWLGRHAIIMCLHTILVKFIVSHAVTDGAGSESVIPGLECPSTDG